MKRFLPLVFFLLFLFNFVPAIAAPLEISGRIVNGTYNDRTVPGVDIKFVRLMESAPNGQAMGRTTSRPDGRFRAVLNVETADVVFGRIDWQGYPYVFPVYDGANQLGANLTHVGQTLRIFDTADNVANAITVVSHQVTLKNEKDSLHVTEQIIAENNSNRTIIGMKSQDFATMGIALPPGAEDVKLEQSGADAKLIKIGKIYSVSRPLLPQTAGGNPFNNAVVFSYHVPWNRIVDMSRRVLYPTKYFAVVRAPGDKDKILVNAPQLGEAHTSQVSMGADPGSWMNSIGRPMDPQPALKGGTMLKIELTRPTQTIIWLFLGLTVLLCIFLPTVMLWNRGGKARPELGNGALPQLNLEPSATASVNIAYPSASAASPHSSARESLGEEATLLVHEIADLDNDWESLGLTRHQYDEQRKALKNRLVGLLQGGNPS